MPRVDVRLFADDYIGRYRRTQLLIDRRMEAAALIATDASSRRALLALRNEMAAARLGRLGNAVAQTSDLQKTKTVFRTSDGFRASGMLYVRSRSERTVGALAAYTRGANIRPVRSRWLWIPTDDIPRVSKKMRLTPALWQKNGLESSIGPLVRIRSINGNPLLIVKNVGVSQAGKRRSAKGLRRDGNPRKGQRLKEFLVAFVGIPNTVRAARVDVQQIVNKARAALAQDFNKALERTVR